MQMIGKMFSHSPVLACSPSSRVPWRTRVVQEAMILFGKIIIRKGIIYPKSNRYKSYPVRVFLVVRLKVVRIHSFKSG